VARKIAVNVEDLEGRSLPSGIAYSLTTDHLAYQVGQPIQITFTETNAGDEPVSVEVHPTDFTIVDSSGFIWQSNPSAAGQPTNPVALQPGQSVIQTATWDGTTPYTLAAPDGNSPTSQINRWGTFFVSNPNAPQADVATFQIADPFRITLMTDQPVYQVGQPVTMTFTETNTTKEDLTYFADASPSALTVWHDGSAVISLAYPQPVGIAIGTWPAGKTMTLSQTWGGIPDAGPYNPATFSGTFDAATARRIIRSNTPRRSRSRLPLLATSSRAFRPISPSMKSASRSR
jgi:hypothetical protein